MKGNSEEKKSGYTTTVGLEVHAELSTKSKMFCGCSNDPHHGAANANICPICMGHPGTLPVVNKEAIKKVLMVGTALGASLATYTEFDRKNYFYPDIPKGYQISQYKYPLVSGGELAGVAITRIHLEEDTARSSHEHTEGSLVDYNRAGVPLMELVTEPVIHEPETAGHFARELQLLLRTLGVADANMEKGEMRVEANISVSKDAALGTKVEVKNLNSFKAVESAISYEVKRHIEALEKGGVIEQETRGWDENRSVTFPQRKKESSHDYRYFPDPDIPSFTLSESGIESVDRLSEIMPETPTKIRIRYANLGLPSKQVETLLNDHLLREYFETAVSGDNPHPLLAANYLTSDVAGLVAQGVLLTLPDAALRGVVFAQLMELVASKSVTSRVAKDLLLEVIRDGIDPALAVSERGLAASTDEDALRKLVEEVLAEHSSIADEVRSGKAAAVQFLIGQGIKKSKGSADPAILRELFLSTLK